jgi:hypothetical protein
MGKRQIISSKVTILVFLVFFNKLKRTSKKKRREYHVSVSFPALNLQHVNRKLSKVSHILTKEIP